MFSIGLKNVEEVMIPFRFSFVSVCLEEVSPIWGFKLPMRLQRCCSR